MFTLGTNPVFAAKLKLWNYWGGPPVNGQGRLPEATTRIYGTLTNAPLVIAEPPPGTHTSLPGYVPPENTNFFAIAPDQIVGPGIGWYEWDITAWYNACLGQTTTIMVRASASSGYDFPLYEDREGTAFARGAGGTSANGNPRIEYFLVPPRIRNVSVADGKITMSGYYGPPSANYVLLASTNVVWPLSNWTRLATNQFDATGHFSITNTLDPGVSRSFYRLQAP